MDRVLGMTTFVKVVDNGGFAPAARALNMSPSAVTLHVQAIEDRLGVRLLNRTTRHVSMTEAGQAYYDSCVRILADIESTEQAAQELQSKPRGTLRLNASPTMPLIVPAIAEFTAHYPDVSIELTVTGRMVDLVEEGFDLAIRVTPVPDSSLIIRRLAPFRFVVCGAPAYLARRGTPTQLAELADHNCMIYSDSPFGREWHFVAKDGSEQAVPLSGNFVANSGEALRLAAVAGQGLMFAPRFLVSDDVAAGRLVPLLTEFRTVELTVDAIYPHRRYLSAKVRAFLDLFTRHLRETLAGTTEPRSDAEEPAHAGDQPMR